MASSVATGNDFLDDLGQPQSPRGRPVLTSTDQSVHLENDADDHPVSSPLTTPTPPPAHQGSSPAAAAMGDIS